MLDKRAQNKRVQNKRARGKKAGDTNVEDKKTEDKMVVGKKAEGKMVVGKKVVGKKVGNRRVAGTMVVGKKVGDRTVANTKVGGKTVEGRTAWGMTEANNRQACNWGNKWGTGDSTLYHCYAASCILIPISRVRPTVFPAASAPALPHIHPPRLPTPPCRPVRSTRVQTAQERHQIPRSTGLS